MEPKDEIKQRLDIVDLVSEYIPLKPAGSGNFKGLCPFHGEKTPSLYVSREKDIWHCFGCDKGGDIFSFLMELEGMTFPEVLQFLGKKAGVEIPEFTPEKGRDEKQFIFGLHELAGRFYETILHKHDEGGVARQYLKQRGIDDELAKKFQLGYAPERWDALVQFLLGKEFVENQITAAGLAKFRQSGNGLIDRFRGRLMIPLFDSAGHLVGFTGRILKEEENAPKYLNSPETMIYHKSDVLFGLHLAKRAIRHEKAVIIVEGNLDVIASHKAGVENIVASSGTALTESQLRQLQKITNRLIFSFDRDAAGFEAARRGIRIAQSMGFDIRVIQILPSDGKDPDDLVQKNPARWVALAQKPVHVMDYYFAKALDDYNVSEVDGKRAMAHFILQEISRLADNLDQEHWIQKLSDVIHVETSILRGMLTKQEKEAVTTQPKTFSAETEVKKITTLSEKAASFLIGLLFSEEDAVNDILPRLKIDDLPDPWQRIYKEFIILYNQRKSENHTQNTFFSLFQDHLSTIGLESQISKLSASVIRAKELIDGFTRDQVREEISRHLSLIASKSHDAKRKQLEAAIRQAELSGDEDRLRALIEQYTKLLN
ncbi:MAG: DNA primase [Patescibacteria group bacterium]